MRRQTLLTIVFLATTFAVACSSSSGEVKEDTEPGMTGAPSAPEKVDAVTKPAPTRIGPKLPDVTKTFRPSGEVGASKTRVDGCLTVKGSDGGIKFPASGAKSPQSSVKVVMTGTGVIVNHTLNHGCCLNAKVDTRVDGNKVVVREMLSGEACRCMCGSTIKTAVRLMPGTYTITVELDGIGKPTVAHQEEVQVRPIMGR